METPMTTATSIPADWDITDPTTWTLSQTVDVHMGYHQTGMVVRALQHISYRVTDLDHGAETDAALARGEDPSELAAWWSDVLDGMMAGRIALAEASPEELERAAAILNAPELLELGYLDAADGDLERSAASGRTLAEALTHAHTELTGQP